MKPSRACDKKVHLSKVSHAPSHGVRSLFSKPVFHCHNHHQDLCTKYSLCPSHNYACTCSCTVIAVGGTLSSNLIWAHTVAMWVLAVSGSQMTLSEAGLPSQGTAFSSTLFLLPWTARGQCLTDTGFKKSGSFISDWPSSGVQFGIPRGQSKAGLEPRLHPYLVSSPPLTASLTGFFWKVPPSNTCRWTPLPISSSWKPTLRHIQIIFHKQIFFV